MDEYVFENANDEDIKEIALIEKEFFGDYADMYDMDFLTKWYSHNPGMFWVVRDTQSGQVVGFTITAPVTSELYDKMLSGEVHDMDKFSASDVLTHTDSEYYYFADICLSKKRINGTKNRFLALVAMMSGIQNHLDKTGVKHVVSTAITDEGVQTSLGMGFEDKGGYDLNGRVVHTMVLEATPEKKQEILGRMAVIKARIIRKKG